MQEESLKGRIRLGPTKAVKEMEEAKKLDEDNVRMVRTLHVIFEELKG